MFILNRVFSLAFVAGLALIYIARRPPNRGRHDAVAFVVSMYASFVLLAFRPVALILEIPTTLNTSSTALDISNLLVIVGVGLSVYSLIFLRLNFSIMPEARDLITHGPYRLRPPPDLPGRDHQRCRFGAGPAELVLHRGVVDLHRRPGLPHKD